MWNDFLDGAGLVYYNATDRNVPREIQIGKDFRSLLLEINQDMDKVNHFGIDHELEAIEVRVFTCMLVFEPTSASWTVGSCIMFHYQEWKWREEWGQISFTLGLVARHKQ